jgi:hypothetical protein
MLLVALEALLRLALGAPPPPGAAAHAAADMQVKS